MQTKILGTTLPVLECVLSAGEAVIGEAGRMSWMSEDVTMATSTAYAGGSGGIMGAIKRVAGGGTLFTSSYTAGGSGGLVAFSTTIPGQILPISVTPAQDYIVHRHGFLAATNGVALSSAFQQSLGGALFGGEGFILQRVGGTCDAWIQLQGEVVTYDLAPGQNLFVHPAHIGMFTEGTQFSITTIKGLKNKFFGGEFFLVKLTGPGKVWLQSLTLQGLAQDLMPYLPTGEAAGGGGVAGGLIGGLLKG
jgi:uncharacterized protein (TIGR00266 family)